MKRGRKKKFITVRVYIKDEEVYIEGERILNELKEIKILDILRGDIYKAINKGGKLCFRKKCF